MFHRAAFGGFLPPKGTTETWRHLILEISTPRSTVEEETLLILRGVTKMKAFDLRPCRKTPTQFKSN